MSLHQQIYKKNKIRVFMSISKLAVLGLLIVILVIFPQYVFATTPDLRNPGVIMKICADDPAFLSNLEGNMYETPLDWFLFWCPEVYEGYSPTTRFAVLIHAPAWNTDPDKIDHIGNTEASPIIAYSGKGLARLNGLDSLGLPCTGFAELGPDTGLFQGLVLLTGFQHDYDGDGFNDTVPPLWELTDCGSASPFGEVQSAAYLQTETEGGITITWEVTEGFTLIKSLNYSFKKAEVYFDKQVYGLEDEVIVIMNDLDYMLYDGYVFPWFVRVWSDSDTAGINVRVFWDEDLNYPTPYFLHGEFYGKFILTETDDSQPDSRLRVKQGDKIYVEFDDYTMPSLGNGDYVTVSNSAEIVFSNENPTGITLNDVKPTNYQGEAIEGVKAGNTIQIQALVENHTPRTKTVTCIILIQNSEGVYENISWTWMNLPSNSITDVNQSWKSSTEGDYTAQIFIWEQITNGIPLTETKETSFVVFG